MAASKGKLSPSNASVEAKAAGTTAEDPSALPSSTDTLSAAAPESTAVGVTLKDPPTSSSTTTTAAVAASTASKSLLTYEHSEQSVYYVQAKDLMKTGDFEQALEVVEQGILAMREAVEAASFDTEQEKILVMQEVLAPLHYMYGTTLLYSVEESSDNDQNMTNLPTTTTPGDEEQENEEGPEVNADGNENEEDGGNEQGEEGGAAEGGDDADDVEIAWENLETARATLEQLINARTSKQQSNDDNSSSAAIDKLRQDLGQVFLREGDLQRINNHYEEAIRDYSSCLKQWTNNSHLEPYDRRLADVHYNLGLAYIMQVAEANTQSDNNDDDNEEGGSSKSVPKTPQEIATLRGKAFSHYLQCGRTFCGKLAQLSGRNPEIFLTEADQSLAQLKSTGDEEDNEKEADSVSPKVVSHKLKILRDHVSKLTAPSQEEQDGIFDHVKELLIEIQETVDEAETSEQGVHQMHEMKAEITAAVAGQASPTKSASGVTTQIGFGAAPATALAAATTCTATAAARPVMMVVKKKKKRDAEDANLPQSDSKRANVSNE